MAAEIRTFRDRRDQLERALLASRPMSMVSVGEISPARIQAPVALLYLARKIEGIASFRRFAEAYRHFSPGVEHHLVVIYKAFGRDADPALAEARRLFADIPHTTMIVPNIGFDLGSYAFAAQRIASPFVCCLNTFSEPLCDGWLGNLYRSAAKPEVGIAGASCSYESPATSLTLFHKALYYQRTFPGQVERSVQDYFGFLFPKLTWRQAMGSRVCQVLSCARRRGPSTVDWDSWVASWLKTTKEPLRNLLTFPSFPNPHVRSNAFVMRREQLLEWLDPLPTTKEECIAMESGPNSLTRRLLRERLAAVVVGRNGQEYPVEQFPESDVFRSGTQANLMVADNKTREFWAMPPKQRTLFTRISWGDYLLQEPADFPAFSAAFPRNPPITTENTPGNADTSHFVAASCPEVRHANLA